jgi:hypothetical protein
MDDSRRLRIPEHVLHQNLQGEMVLLDLNSNTYFGLDEVGTRFWELVGADGRPGAVIDSMLQEYEVERADLEADLGRLVEELVEKGLLEVDEPVE